MTIHSTPYTYIFKKAFRLFHRLKNGDKLEAYVLINTEPGRLWEVAEATLKIKGVKKAHAVAGQYDVIAYVEFVEMSELGRIIHEIQSIKGIMRTQTAIAMALRLKE
jgi:DNA-binding Lrp family transcriptional regulator